MKIARVLSYYDYNDMSYSGRAPSTSLKLLTLNIFNRKKIIDLDFYGGGYFSGFPLCLYRKNSFDKNTIVFIDNEIKFSILTKRQIKKIHILFPELLEDN